MYIGNICAYLGSPEAVSQIPYLIDDPKALRTLAENKMVAYTKLNDTVAGAAEKVLNDLIHRSGLDLSSIGGIIFTRICETNAEKLDQEFDAGLTRTGLRNIPVYHIAGGQCGTPAMQLHFAKSLLAADDSLDNLVVISSNIVGDSQKRNQVGNTVILADGAVSFLVSRGPLEFEIVGAAIHFDHELRERQASAEFSDSIRAFKLLGSGLKAMNAKILLQCGTSATDAAAVITSNSCNAVGQLTEALRVPAEKIYVENIPLFAHNFGSEVYHTLDICNSAGRYKSNDLIVLYHCGYSALGLTALRKV